MKTQLKTTQLTKALILVTVVSGVLAAGCELIVDFDRTKIPVEPVDAGLIDAAGFDEGGIINPEDAGDGSTEAATEEAGADAGDAGDAGSDADAAPQDAAADG